MGSVALYLPYQVVVRSPRSSVVGCGKDGHDGCVPGMTCMTGGGWRSPATGRETWICW